MRLSGADETDLLTALHEGVLEEPLWSTFLDRLRARAQADTAGIMFRFSEAGGQPPFILRSGRLASEPIERRYLLERQRDPIPYASLRLERVYALGEFLDMTNPEHVRYCSEILEPAGFRHARLIRVAEPGGATAWCGIGRADRDFPASAGALLSAVAPHLRIALRNHAAVQRERLRADISADVVQRLNLGWLTLDAAGRVVGVDGKAAQLLQRSAALRRTRHQTLITGRAAADRDLADMLRAVRSGEAVRPRLIHVGDQPWFDMFVVPVASEASMTPERPALVIYLQGDAQSGVERRDQLMSLFGLSLNEAQLALALSHGQTIAEAATELGLSQESARTYTKRIYRKTSTRGQVDLVRLILASVIALA